MAKLENLATENITSEGRQRLEQFYRMQTAYYRLIRSHQEAAEVVMHPFTTVLRQVEDDIYLKGAPSAAIASGQTSV